MLEHTVHCIKTSTVCDNLGCFVGALLACHVLCGSRHPMTPAWGKSIGPRSHPNLPYAAPSRHLYVPVHATSYQARVKRHRSGWSLHSTSSLMLFVHNCHTRFVCWPHKLVFWCLGSNCSYNQNQMKRVPLWDCSKQFICCQCSLLSMHGNLHAMKLCKQMRQVADGMNRRAEFHLSDHIPLCIANPLWQYTAKDTLCSLVI